jgi:hypothetical protein
MDDDLLDRMSTMTGDLQAHVSSAAHMANADVRHLLSETTAGMMDIAASRLPDPDENINLPPSIIAIANGETELDIVARRSNRHTAARSTPTSSTGSARQTPSVGAPSARLYLDLHAASDARARRVIEETQAQAAETIAAIRIKLGLGD